MGGVGNASPVNQVPSKKDLSKPYFLSLLNWLDRVPLPPLATYAIVALISYVIYLILALSTGVFAEAVTSFMHLQQISFSIAIFVGFTLGRESSLSFDRAFAHSKDYFCIDSSKYNSMVKNTRDVAGKWYSLLLAVPLMALSSLAYYGVGLSAPNDLFPVSMSSPLFIYFAFVEFSVFCLYLLGALGFWFLLVVSRLFKELEQFDLRLRALRASSQLYELPGVILKTTVYLFIIMSIVLPPLVYIVIQYRQGTVLWAGSIGVAGAYAILLTLTGITQFSIHRMMIKAKYRRLDEISDAFERTQIKIETFPAGFSTGEAGYKELSELINLNEYFREVYKETNEAIPEWTFDLRNLGELVASGLIPVASLIGMIISLFQS